MRNIWKPCVLETGSSSLVSRSVITVSGTGCYTGVLTLSRVCSTALHCTALHCTALHCTALHCTALHVEYTGNAMQCSAMISAFLFIIASCNCGGCPMLNKKQFTVCNNYCTTDGVHYSTLNIEFKVNN